MKANPLLGRTPRALACRALLALVPVAVAVALWSPSRGSSKPTFNPALEFCVTAPKEAHVDAAQHADLMAEVEVPRATPDPSLLMASRPVAQGDVIRVKVTSTRPGAVAVHGLMDVQPIGPGGEVTVAFRMIYSGRFPLHFHGDDGSHFELLAFEAGPASQKRSP